jgi:hypothetical protein
MARGRILAKVLSTSRKYARLFDVLPDLAEFCQSLYPLLLAHADDFGRLQGDIFTVRHSVHPTSPRGADDFERAVKALHDVGLIVWYEARGRQCIQVAEFDRHQQGLHKRTRSEFPAVPGNSGNFLDDAEIFDDFPVQGKGREEKGTEEKGREKTIGGALTPAATPLLTFPTIGAGPKEWYLTKSLLDEWNPLYPSLDIFAQCQRALAWVRTDPVHRKTAKGMPRFLVAWFNRFVRGQARRRRLSRLAP